jgi:long-chain acyl-CoA synthetase
MSAGASQQSRRGDGILLTGATGFLGMELLARYLQRTDRRIYALVRAASEREASTRVERALRTMFGTEHPHRERVVPVRGDLTRPGLGLGRRWRNALAGSISEIVHGAASVSFEMGLEEARAVNVQGTRRVLELAERCGTAGAGLRRLTYISTAYVAGDHAGRFSEDDLDVGQGFRNPYERSKFEAERLVKRWGERLPVTVTRPSIVVGERGSGWTASFNVLYWPLRAFSRGTYVALPGRGAAPVDVVPVDYVTDAVFALSQAPEALGGTFHLTAGRNVATVGEVVRLASDYFRRPAPALIDPTVYGRVVHPVLMRAIRDERRRSALRRSEVFFPYFAARVRYDDRRTRAILHRTGIECSPLRDYFQSLLEFALAADWGRRPLPRKGTVVPLTTRRARRWPAYAPGKLVSVG